MKCPSCKNAKLVEKTTNGGALTLDLCVSCKGAWFDKGELHSLLGKKSAGVFEIPRISQKNDNMRCPRCEEGMHEMCYPSTTVFIDVCKECRGIWLDYKEWEEIKSTRTKKLERQARENVTSEENEKASKASARKNALSEPRSYADNISGLKGTLLRFIDRAITYLTNY